MKRVMIVDALNAYFRAFIVNPSLSVHGQPIGGLKGFLGILQKLCRAPVAGSPGVSNRTARQFPARPNRNCR